MTTKEFVTMICDDGTIVNQKIDIKEIPEMHNRGVIILKIQDGQIVYADVDRNTEEFFGFKKPEIWK